MIYLVPIISKNIVLRVETTNEDINIENMTVVY